MDREEILQLLRNELRIEIEGEKDYDGDIKVTSSLRLEGELISQESFYIPHPRY